MDFKQVIVVRSDLKMGKGKIAAQAGHAAVSAAEKSQYKKEWLGQGQKKTVLKVDSEAELIRILQEAKDRGLPVCMIEDAGHTQLEPGTRTCVGIGPAPADELDRLTGELKLL
ncbi:MAG: peptidyl-tRNA hydrolase Pth2 [Candidatus Altiarchaeota archaeon]|nr:peptidyl-tRNA hydrolase Pth2 [Candidatus Altiarchaeota archaeon]